MTDETALPPQQKPAWEIPTVEEKAQFVPVSPAPGAQPPAAGVPFAQIPVAQVPASEAIFAPPPAAAPAYAPPAAAAPPAAPAAPAVPGLILPEDLMAMVNPPVGQPLAAPAPAPSAAQAPQAPSAPAPSAVPPTLASMPAPTLDSALPAPGPVPVAPTAAAPMAAAPMPPAPMPPAPMPSSAPAAQLPPPPVPTSAPALASAPAPGAQPVMAAAPAPNAEVALAATPIANGDIISALEQVLFTGASDLHVTANSMPMLRVDGRLRPVPGATMWNQDEVTAAVRALMTEEQQETFDKNHELDFAYALPGGTRFRVNCYQQRGATGAAFRIISTTIRSLEELGVPDVVASFATLPRGLVLVTGPTGSGKSTTLAALIDLVNRTRYDHIVTVEDPIEYVHGNKRSLINQREVGSDTHSFAAALKHVLRQDPAVILVGEMRDLETISVALTAAETGHLVFATLHTQDAAQTIDRIIDVYPSHQQDQIRTQLAATLQGVVSQTLVPRASGAGRVIATEVLITTPAIANLIREGTAHQITSAMQAGRALGMHTMDQHLADLVNEGQITREQAFEKAHDPDSLERLIRREDIAGSALTFDPSAFTMPEQIGRH
ncbi:MAG: type IV pilus twitching motility protein PilT [Pseudolysinimonas sp.]